MIIEPLKQDRKLSSYLDEGTYRSVLIVFWHGIGDVIQFMNIYDSLRFMYPGIMFDIGLQRGLDQETVIPDAVLLPDLNNIEDRWDLTALIHFPVETDPNLTKSELCCKLELGIPPVWGHKILPRFQNRIVGVHFNITCLPTLANPSEEVAKQIWDDILTAGCIPIETHFEHVYHNPVNKKFDFIDCTVRKCTPRISTLAGLLQNCGAFIGVVSGNFHCAMASLPHNRIAFLEKDIPVARFTREPIKVFDVKDYKKGEVTDWLTKICG